MKGAKPGQPSSPIKTGCTRLRGLSAIGTRGVGDNETRRFLLGMVEASDLVLAVLTPRYLATWGL